MAASLPRLLITMGDIAGIGPEIMVRAWPELTSFCTPIAVGDPNWLRRAASEFQPNVYVKSISTPGGSFPDPEVISCWNPSSEDLSSVVPGKVTASAGRAAYDYLCGAIDLAMKGEAEGIVTAPLHKEGLHAAGLHYPGHTEILAERTGVKNFAMVLAVPGLAVAHVTLHMALKNVFSHLTQEGIIEKAHLLHDLLIRLIGRKPRLAVAALNPHASDGGLFGDEEATLIAPAVGKARTDGLDVTGPIPCDTLFVRARAGEFDGVVAMYHDQGHIALKLFGLGRAVNISVGLPIVRTSVAHGTAYDIAWKGKADASSLVQAAKIAAQLGRKS